MTTAEKLIAIAENVPKVYEAGKAAGGGAVAVEEKDVNFYDYDGTLLYSYTLAEAQELTELPPAPTPKRDFLLFQEWNWTLEQIKAAGHWLDVGAIYITKDGKTRAVVEIVDLVQPDIKLNFKGATCVVDWGDGTIETKAAGNWSHTYRKTGAYTISLSVESGTLDPTAYSLSESFIGDITIGSRTKLKAFYGGNKLSSNFAWLGFINCKGLTEFTIPVGITKIAGTVFSNAKKLKHFNFPSTITVVDSSSFQFCESLAGVSINPMCLSIGGLAFITNKQSKVSLPDISAIPTEMFSGNESLAKVFIPNTIISIGNRAFLSCRSLASLIIPGNVETIDYQAFQNCEYLGRLSFLPTTPPTVANANAFSGIPTTCIVEVPAASLEAYKNATNYGSIAAQMVGV